MNETFSFENIGEYCAGTTEVPVQRSAGWAFDDALAVEENMQWCVVHDNPNEQIINPDIQLFDERLEEVRYVNMTVEGEIDSLEVRVLTQLGAQNALPGEYRSELPLFDYASQASR